LPVRRGRRLNLSDWARIRVSGSSRRSR
jgi:hypothetical protein